jgi:DnaA family protein
MGKLNFQQHVFDGFVLPSDKNFENFVAGGNATLIAALHQLVAKKSEPMIYFYGSSGVGKTHLLLSCCQEMEALGQSYLYLPLQKIQELQPTVFENLETLSCVCIDDIQQMAGHLDWEEAFLDFFHRMMEARKRLLITGQLLPQYLHFKLRDVASRLKTYIVFQARELTEEEKLYALVKRAREQGILLQDRVVRFILRRYPRDLGSLLVALENLDRASLAAQHKITIPFVKKVLGL